MGPLRACINVSDGRWTTLLNTTLSVVDFGTANDLEASTPISCGLGMAFVKDPRDRTRTRSRWWPARSRVLHLYTRDAGPSRDPTCNGEV